LRRNDDRPAPASARFRRSDKPRSGASDNSRVAHPAKPRHPALTATSAPTALLRHPGESQSLPRRKPGSSPSPFWIPAFAGMTVAFSPKGNPWETSFNRRFAPPSRRPLLSPRGKHFTPPPIQRHPSESPSSPHRPFIVTPAKAGVQSVTTLDSGFRRNDDR
jgi:hypothetical protein